MLPDPGVAVLAVGGARVPPRQTTGHTDPRALLIIIVSRTSDHHPPTSSQSGDPGQYLPANASLRTHEIEMKWR